MPESSKSRSKSCWYWLYNPPFHWQYCSNQCGVASSAMSSSNMTAQKITWVLKLVAWSMRVTVTTTVVVIMHLTSNPYGLKALTLFTRRTSTTSISNPKHHWWGPLLKKHSRKHFDMGFSRTCFLLRMISTSSFVRSFEMLPGLSMPPRSPTGWHMTLPMGIKLDNWYELFSILYCLLKVFKVKTRFLNVRTNLCKHAHEHIGGEYRLQCGCAEQVTALLTDDNFIYKRDVRYFFPG